MMDFDVDMALSRPIESSVPTRWERKQAAQSTSVTSSTKTPLKATTSSSSSQRTPLKTPNYSDRFIPTREGTHGMQAFRTFDDENKSASEYETKLAENLLSSSCGSTGEKILKFKSDAPKPTEAHTQNLRVLYTQNRDNLANASVNASAASLRRTFRHIPTSAERVLDAPDLSDDYYLNLLDWGSNGLLAIGLGRSVYLWDSATGNTEELVSLQNDEKITSVQFMQDASHLAIATTCNDVQMWDIARKKKVRNMTGHLARVASLAWNNFILSSGSRDASIFHHDVRIAQHHVATLKGHEQEVCGLKWSPDGTQLASGSNDNTCRIWDLSSSTATYVFNESQAAVKALAWCPWQRHTLATGSGTADRHIRFYNTNNGTLLNAIDTQSQVCSLQWSKTEKELISSHGFSQNQLSVWKFPSLVKMADLIGHTSRVLHTSVSPDGSTVVSAGADESLRFWRVWDSVQNSANNNCQQLRKDNIITSAHSRLNMTIR